jgi:hypothetical protein
MADQRDPVDVVISHFSGECCGELWDALQKLKSRARVERRLEAWLKEGQTAPVREARAFFDLGAAYVHLYCGPTQVGAAGAPDYWSALSAALDAAGAEDVA